MAGDPNHRGVRGGVAWLWALLLATAPACFSDPGNMDDGDTSTSTSTEETGDTSDTETGESTSDDGDSETGEPPPDAPDPADEESGEPDPPECLWLRFGENADDDVKAVTIDTWIDEENPSTNKGADDDLSVDGASEQELTETALIRFDLSGMPEGEVTDALLHLATNGDEGSESSPGSQFSLHAMGDAWVEGQATWLEASEGVPWSVTGCAAPPCRSETELVFFEPTEQNHRYELPLDPSLVEAWRDDPQTNHGLSLSTPASNGGDFHSSESKDGVMRPALEVRVCPES